ncbi:MAG: transglutaminase-like domain-containing protein [Chloroflexi bacterium]|nr:transglutaminase-like domain-containing protein [Chloroflexota bacterium]
MTESNADSAIRHSGNDDAPQPPGMTIGPAPVPDDRAVQAMVDMLADDDPAIRARVILHLAQAGQRAVTALMAAERTTAHPHRIAEVLAAIHREHALGALDRFRSLEPAGAAETGALLVAQVQHPHIDTHELLQFLDQLADAAPAPVRESDPERALRSLAVYLSSVCGFDGARTDYPNPANSLLDQVVKRRIGLPISLAVVYLAVARRVGMPLEGVGLPAHFVLRHPGAADPQYLDPFNRARLLYEDECGAIVRAHGVTLRRHHLAAVSPQEIAARICRNLILAYRRQQDHEREDLARDAHRRLRPGQDLLTV